MSAKGMSLVILAVLATVFLLSGWLTYREGGIGAGLATPPGSILFAMLFVLSGLVAAFVVTSRFAIFFRAVITVASCLLLSGAVVVCDNAGFKHIDDLVMNTIVRVRSA
jgi:hypothetical protein